MAKALVLRPELSLLECPHRHAGDQDRCDAARHGALAAQDANVWQHAGQVRSPVRVRASPCRSAKRGGSVANTRGRLRPRRTRGDDSKESAGPPSGFMGDLCYPSSLGHLASVCGVMTCIGWKCGNPMQAKPNMVFARSSLTAFIS